jgi:hypothetical protein
MDATERIVLPVVTPRTFTDRCEIITDAETLQNTLSGENLRLFRDHQLSFNHHVLLRTIEGDCYVMMNRTLKTIRGSLRLPFARVHHIETLDVFARHLDKLVVNIAVTLKVVALIVDERMLRGATPWHSFQRPGGERQAAFRSKTLTAEDIDGLYSENVLLNY